MAIIDSFLCATKGKRGNITSIKRKHIFKSDCFELEVQRKEEDSSSGVIVRLFEVTSPDICDILPSFRGFLEICKVAFVISADLLLLFMILFYSMRLVFSCDSVVTGL
ncbi:uncharacterized protein [Solanum lycopersicum]|uniref:uncharacterized protein isoform X1 n=1 Tax=Solanum lycopersicum TaxID=4081 RepID=UPI003747F023